jgi:hypothetical protein
MYIVNNIHYQFYYICLIYITATCWQHNAINEFDFFFVCVCVPLDSMNVIYLMKRYMMSLRTNKKLHLQLSILRE